MNLDIPRTRELLQAFDFNPLFTEELGWDHHTQSLSVPLDEHHFTLSAIAQKRGMVAFACAAMSDGCIPSYATRRKIEHCLSRSVHEHLIIYTDANKTTQIWQWVKREPGRPAACREHQFYRNQSGEALIQKLEAIAFTLTEEESLTIVDVAGRTRAAFDLERVTRRFYDRFKKEHDSFLKFLKGIPGEEFQSWYASVMINRLMFIYFIQKKGFLNEDTHYLRSKLKEISAFEGDCYYTDFLCPLFFEGFAKREDERTPDFNRLLGRVPYLNGGIFQRHQIEELHGTTIQIADAAFEKIFDFFDQYQWHLDERPLRRDDEINPDVLGYIFEKYINQKQMGAYYTRDDITGYISQNTVIPRLFDRARQKCKIAFEGEPSVWQHLQENPDRYIYAAVKHGIDLPLPPEIAAGLEDVSQRTGWNRPAPGEYALPTEIWREVVARRQRCEEVRAKLAGGEVRAINDLITCNLDIRQFAQDVIENSEGPELLRAFWQALRQITILDPTCGSGAFLFAALNILEPLYEACLNRMHGFLEDLERSGEKHRPEKFSDFREALAEAGKHPNLRYFILKSIILNNLYGVDIMEEAVEICKLRLFLKLVAQVKSVDEIEPLPDIDFNICAGNTLVGYATREEIQRALTMTEKAQGKMLLFAEEQEIVRRIEEKAEDVDCLFSLFRRQQTVLGGDVTAADKQQLRDRLKSLGDELNICLAGEYKVPAQGEGPKAISLEYQRWLASHKPFHWFVDFHGIMRDGGFDVIIGNPPYVEYSKVKGEYTIRGYQTESCGNLYAFVTERSLALLRSGGRFGMIVPSSASCTDGFIPLQNILLEQNSLWVSSYSDQRGKLFDIPHPRLCIIIYQKGIEKRNIFATSYTKLGSAGLREHLFQRLEYASVMDQIRRGIIPRYGTGIEHSIDSKVFRQEQRMGHYVTRSGTQNLYYTRKISWFVQVTPFIPKIVDSGNNTRDPSELKTLTFVSLAHADIIFAALNSTLFYWFVTTGSDCRNLNMREVLGLSLNLDTMTSPIQTKLRQLANGLAEDLNTKSEFRTMSFNDVGELNIQCLFAGKSKSIIDEIDRVLAQHYGFTEEELDFIINYDIKYRIGRDVMG